MIEGSHIKQLAKDAGFDLCGITPAQHLTANEAYFREWMDKGCFEGLNYLHRNVEKRFDPSLLVEGGKSVVVCAVSYKSNLSGSQPKDSTTKIASYALMCDYHTTIRQMLQQILTTLQANHPTLRGRCFVDTAPLCEKQLAVEAGLGWIGRQSLLVTPQFGSYILLGVIVLEEAIDHYDQPFQGSRCGRCYNCIDSCPTKAIVEPRRIDTRRCISRNTIEAEPIAESKLHGWIFGCEECLGCCPYNHKAHNGTNPNFQPTIDPTTLTPKEWESMSEERFKEKFKTTPISRSKLERIQNNINQNKKDSLKS